MGDENWGADGGDGDGGDDWGGGGGGEGGDDGGWGDESELVTDPSEVQEVVTKKKEEPKGKSGGGGGGGKSGWQFSQKAYGKLPKRVPPKQSTKDLTGKIPQLMKESVKGVEGMRSQTRDARPVVEMIVGVYRDGLFTLGNSTSPINSQVIPAIRYIFDVCAELKPNDIKRVSLLTTLANAMQDCQQVQAREILRAYGDLTNQNQTFESQMQWFLLKQKEDALERFITQFHPSCDKDHTQVQPWQQRAHLKSAYIDLLGDEFGLEAVEAARSDRFLTEAKNEIEKGVWGGAPVKSIFLMLKKQLDLDAFLAHLLADINNQSPNADRLINPDVIFKWVQANLSKDEAHKVFYDESRASEYEGQEPSKPLEKNQYLPFLSRPFLLQILVAMGFLEKA